jgi:hypothetical protein
MPSEQHLMLARETTWGTWVAPTMSLPVTSAGINAEQPIIVNADTGGGRGQRPGVAGALTVSGDIKTKLYPRTLGHLIRSMYGTRAKTSSVSAATVAVSGWLNGAFPGPGTRITTSAPHGMAVGDRLTVAGATGGTPSPNGEHTVITVQSDTVLFINLSSTVAGSGGTIAKTSIRSKLLMNDSAAFDSFSIQKRYSATVAESIRGAKVAGYKLTAKAKEFADLTVMMHALDAATKGATTSYWADGVTAAPNVVDPPAPYALGVNDPIAFVGGSITLGGSVAVTAGELVYSGGTMRRSIDNIDLEIRTDLVTDDFEIYRDSRLLGSLGEGKRTITIGWEPNFDIVGNEFYAAWKAGATAVVKLAFQGRLHGATGVYEGFEWVFPLVRYDSAANPEISADYSIQRVPVKAIAYVDPVTGYDHGLVVTSGEDYTV